MDEGMKLDALKALDSAPMKQLMEVLRARTPNFSDSANDLATVAMQAKLREGYEMALDLMVNIPREVSPDTTKLQMESALLDPRD